MNLRESQHLLAAALAGCRCSAPSGSPYGNTGQSLLRMAAAYESDGRTFIADGDPVNALAASAYGLGWLHFGCAAGLLATGTTGCLFDGPFEPVPASQQEKRNEKTGRYARLLATALASVTPAPDPSTPAHALAGQVMFIANLYLQQGERFASGGRTEDALACYSYGHGWLDAGVQAGLFSIHANRGIFTVD
jgi:uncharacterized protein